jgi:hypothetical protein
MIQKLKQLFNEAIKQEHKGSYYTLTECPKCRCGLFPSEIMCPDCLYPVIEVNNDGC